MRQENDDDVMRGSSDVGIRVDLCIPVLLLLLLPRSNSIIAKGAKSVSFS